MRKDRPGPLLETDDEVATRRTAGLGGLAITLFLLVLSLSVVHGLRAADTVEDSLNIQHVNRDEELLDIWPHGAASDWIGVPLRSVRHSNS